MQRMFLGRTNRLEDKDLEYIKQWTMDHKEDILPFRDVRVQIKSKMEEIARKETELELEKQLYISLTIIRRRRGEYCRIIPETKSRGLFDNIHRA